MENTNTNKKVMLVVDCLSILSNCFYGSVPPKYNFGTPQEIQAMEAKMLKAPDGRYTEAIVGFFKRLVYMLKTLDEQGYEDVYVACCYDVGREQLLRREKMPEYKAQRKETPAPLRQQIGTLRDALAAMGFKVLKHPQVEADDFAASVAATFKGAASIRLYSQDSDYLQMVDGENDVLLYQLKKDDKECRELEAKYRQPEDAPWPYKCVVYNDSVCYLEKGFWPSQVPDFKGLAGDSSDNIPGVSGVGEASAIDLLWYFKSIENLYDAINACNGDEKALKELFDKVKDALKAQDPEKTPRLPVKKLTAEGAEASAKLSKGIATCITKCRIPQDIEEYSLKRVSRKALEIILSELGIQVGKTVKIPENIQDYYPPTGKDINYTDCP